VARPPALIDMRALRAHACECVSGFTLLSNQEQVSAAIALAGEQQTQKLLMETQLDVTEFDNLLQPIIDTCTKDAISVSCLSCSSLYMWLSVL